MQRTATALAASSEGFLLLDSSMSPIFINPAAAQILTYPQQFETKESVAANVAGRIRSMLLPTNSSRGPALVSNFQSGKRVYRCRSFPVSTVAGETAPLSIAVLLERPSARSLSLAQLSERFNLTLREQEVSQYILQGLTSKEIALKMGISPNTVKAFLRLIMVKMGVSTRSGIAGKVFISHLNSESHP